ncbi:MAG: CAP domain-containing protein [Peptococcaceae bacterium]|nr:CAP domain-containing protein [Peptococcaceae bacterium]
MGKKVQKFAAVLGVLVLGMALCVPAAVAEPSGDPSGDPTYDTKTFCGQHRYFRNEIQVSAEKAKAKAQKEREASQPPQRVVNLVNAERRKAGLRELTLDSRLKEAAQVRAGEITRIFDHTRPNGQDCFSVLDQMGIRYGAAAENIAAGQQTPEAVVQAWMNSPGHRENILNPAFTKIGVGVTGTYWVQLFTS